MPVFGIGMFELILILVVILLVIGPRRLPEMARSIGKILREIRKGTQGLEDAINSQPPEDIRREVEDRINPEIKG